VFVAGNVCSLHLVDGSLSCVKKLRRLAFGVLGVGGLRRSVSFSD
jgi:hypothetical protein